MLLACLVGRLLLLQPLVSGKNKKKKGKSDLNSLQSLSFTTCLSRSYTQEHPKQPLPSRKEVWVHMVFLRASVKLLPTPSCKPRTILLPSVPPQVYFPERFAPSHPGREAAWPSDKQRSLSQSPAASARGHLVCQSCSIFLCLSFSMHSGGDTSLVVKENTTETYVLSCSCLKSGRLRESTSTQRSKSCYCPPSFPAHSSEEWRVKNWDTFTVVQTSGAFLSRLG